MIRITRSSIINWIKMTELKKCDKVINDTKCSCVDELTKLYVTRPGLYYISGVTPSEIELKRRIEIKEKEYFKCYLKKLNK